MLLAQPALWSVPCAFLVMDEAERCHEIAYIAYGELLAHGTVDEVVASSHLSTYVVSSASGDGLAELSSELTGKPGIDMVAPFGTSLHDIAAARERRLCARPRCQRRDRAPAVRHHAGAGRDDHQRRRKATRAATCRMNQNNGGMRSATLTGVRLFTLATMRLRWRVFGSRQ